jgi:hypothetical protein
LTNGNAQGLTKYLTIDQLQQLYQAVHLNHEVDTILWVLDGTLGATTADGESFVAGGGGPHSNTTSSSSIGLNLKAQASAALAGRGDHAAAAGGGGGAGGAADADGGNSSVGRPISMLPYLSLAGVLAAKFGHDASELRGPVTEALAHAQLSTRERVSKLEHQAKDMHREIVLLKRTLAEQRKHEAERIAAALKDQQRRIARRGARPKNTIEKFLHTTWGADFDPLGVSEDIPRILRSTAPVNNKWVWAFVLGGGGGGGGPPARRCVAV